MRLQVEGWRRYAQSLGIIHQYQCLELSRRPDVDLVTRDLPPPPVRMLKRGRAWDEAPEILGPEEDALVRAIPAPAPGDAPPDGTYRIGFPYDFSAAPHGETRVFAITETGSLPEGLVNGPSLADATATDRFAVITASEFSRAGLVASGADPARVLVVPHGFDPTTFHPLSAEARAQVRERLGWRDRFVFLGVSAMYPHKGIEPLLLAFAATAGRHPEALLALKGNDSVYASGQALMAAAGRLDPATRHRIDPQVRYVGETWTARRLATLYQAADVLVSPYHAEGFNLPVIEAAACGLPVICTAGGPTDETTDERFALRVPSTRGPGIRKGGTWLYPDLDALIASMERVTHDEAWMGEARRTGPAHVAARYTWSAVVDGLLAAMRPLP